MANQLIRNEKTRGSGIERIARQKRGKSCLTVSLASREGQFSNEGGGFPKSENEGLMRGEAMKSRNPSPKKLFFRSLTSPSLQHYASHNTQCEYSASIATSHPELTCFLCSLPLKFIARSTFPLKPCSLDHLALPLAIETPDRSGHTAKLTFPSGHVVKDVSSVSLTFPRSPSKLFYGLMKLTLPRLL